MNNYQKLGFISGQVLMGLLFGFAGVIVTALLWTVYEQLTGNYIGDLTTSIFYSLYGGYIGMQIGIGIDGYKYLREKARLRDFKRFFGQSVAGLFLGLLIWYYLILFLNYKIWGHLTPLFSLVPPMIGAIIGYLITIFMFVLPMMVSIIGFDLGLIKKLNDSEKKSG